MKQTNETHITVYKCTSTWRCQTKFITQMWWKEFHKCAAVDSPLNYRHIIKEGALGAWINMSQGGVANKYFLLLAQLFMHEWLGLVTLMQGNTETCEASFLWHEYERLFPQPSQYPLLYVLPWLPSSLVPCSAHLPRHSSSARYAWPSACPNLPV